MLARHAPCPPTATATRTLVEGSRRTRSTDVFGTVRRISSRSTFLAQSRPRPQGSRHKAKSRGVYQTTDGRFHGYILSNDRFQTIGVPGGVARFHAARARYARFASATLRRLRKAWPQQRHSDIAATATTLVRDALVRFACSPVSRAPACASRCRCPARTRYDR